MSKLPASLDQEAVRLLLEALEAPRPILTPAAMAGRLRELCVQLLEAKFLRQCGHEVVVTASSDHDDKPVELTWSADEEAYGYFNPASGWVTVQHADLALYVVDTDVFMDCMTDKFSMAPRPRHTALVPDHLWEIGSARFGRRPQRTPT
jgi:hypothetical protein